MSNTQKQVSPHWIMRLFGVKDATFVLAEQSLTVKSESGDNYTVLTESLANSFVCKNGVLFSKLLLETDKGRKRFGGLRKKDAKQLFAWLRSIESKTVFSKVETSLKLWGI